MSSTASERPAHQPSPACRPVVRSTNTSYNCGFTLGETGTAWCGINVYSSTDLSHWAPAGQGGSALAFDPLAGQWQQTCAPPTFGCFRPHVAYDAHTRRYVMWINTPATEAGYTVLTSARPGGPFTQVAQPPKLAVKLAGFGGLVYGDESLFVDHDGTAYLAYTVIGPPNNLHDIAIERLDPTYTTGTGDVTRLGLSLAEAPSLFERDGTYYATFSDPACPFCTGTGTGYMTAPSPLGPWQGVPGVAEPWTVSGGQLHVNGGDVGVSAAGANWTDYTFSADVTPAQTGTGEPGVTSYAQAGLVFRADDNGDGYAYLLSNFPYTSADAGGYLAFLKLTGGVATLVSSTALPFAVTGGQTYHVSIGVSGSTFTATVNGTLADTVTDSTYAAGKIGFREAAANDESATFDNVAVTAPDGSSLFADDFSSPGLSGWLPPVDYSNSKGIVISSDSCGGQPSFVTALPGRGGGTIYLYGSDLWDGRFNEGLANYFWSPLQFSAGGAIQQVQCTAAPAVSLAIGAPGRQARVPATDQASGSGGFATTCTIAAGTEEMQTFTAGRSGTLRQLRLTAFQQSSTPTGGVTVNAPLSLQLVTLTAQGGIGQVLARQDFAPDAVGFSARDLVMTPEVQVAKGAVYGVVASSATTQACYGVAVASAGPYPRGNAAVSTDGGQTFTAQPSADLKFLTVVQ